MNIPQCTFGFPAQTPGLASFEDVVRSKFINSEQKTRSEGVPYFWWEIETELEIVVIRRKCSFDAKN